MTARFSPHHAISFNPGSCAVDRLRAGLAGSFERDDAGRPQLWITSTDDAALSQFAETLARLLVPKQSA